MREFIFVHVKFSPMYEYLRKITGFENLECDLGLDIVHMGTTMTRYVHAWLQLKWTMVVA